MIDSDTRGCPQQKSAGFADSFKSKNKMDARYFKVK